MANDTLFPSGAAYANLTGRTTVKLFAVDDSGGTLTPGYVQYTPGTGSGGGSGTVNSGVLGQLAYYANSGTSLSTLSLGTNFLIVGGALTLQNIGLALLAQSGATAGQAVVWNGSAWVAQTITGGTAGGGSGNMLYRGAWTANTPYAVNDVVRVVGQAWICTVAHTAGNTFAGSKFASIAPAGAYGALYFPQDYGAAVDGSTDDSTAWTNLIAALRASGRGGCIMLTGMSVCAPGIISLPAFTSVFGHGLQTGVRWRDNSSGDFLMDVSGTGPNNITGYNTLANFCLDGGQGGNAHLLRAFYNAHSEFLNLYGNSASIGFFNAVQLWDFTVRDWQLNYCGTGENTTAVWVRNSGAASGFGYSGDTSNQGVFQRIRIEDCYGCAFAIERGTNNGNPPNGITVDFLKVETNNAISRPMVYLGPGTSGCTFNDLYISVNGRASGNAAVDALQNNGGGGNTFNAVRVTQNASGIIDHPINHNAGGTDHYSDLIFTGSGGVLTPAANAMLCVTGGVQPVLSGFVNSFPSIPATSGYTPPASGNATISGVSIDGSAIVASTSSPYQMQAADRVIDVNKGTGAATRILLPANPTLWVEYTVIDGKGDAGTNNVTVAAASGTTINGQPSFTLKANNDAITFRAVSATVWRIT